MSNVEKWREGVYEETFELTMRALEDRKANDPNFGIDRMQGLLETEYINEGNDWVGRGELFSLKQSATIAAYQQFLADWKKQDEEEALMFFKSKETDRWFESQGQSTLAALGVKPGWKVLDIGCGIGSYCIPLAKAVGPDGRIFAVDTSERSEKAIQKQLDKMQAEAPNLEFHHVDKAPSYPWVDDDSLDAVWVFDVLQHIDDWDGLLREAKRMLRRAGRLYVNPSEMMHADQVDAAAFLEKAAGYGLQKIDQREVDLMHYKKMGRDRVYTLELAE